jgi:hypothetical protein
VVATICEELITRGVGEMEMVFQLPGNKDTVSKLKAQFDNGWWPLPGSAVLCCAVVDFYVA